MLGNRILDPDGIEGEIAEEAGLGLLDIDTVISGEKRLEEVTGASFDGVRLSGYEMHIGISDGLAASRPFATIAGASEGAISADGRVFGTYLHGLFANDQQRSAWLRRLGAGVSEFNYEASVDEVLDKLAAHIEQHLDVTALLKIAS